MPKPNERHEMLKRLVGDWRGKETMSGSPMGPGGVFDAHMTMRIDIDGFFIIQEYTQEVDGMILYRGHGTIGWNSKEKKYVWYWVDSSGDASLTASTGDWKGDELVLTHPPQDGRRGRYTYRFNADSTLAFTIDNSQDDGATWQRLLDGTYTKS